MLKLNVCVRVCGIYIYDTNMASCINLQSGFFHGSELIDFSVFVCTQICNHPPYVCLDMHTLTQTYMHTQTDRHTHTHIHSNTHTCNSAVFDATIWIIIAYILHKHANTSLPAANFFVDFLYHLSTLFHFLCPSYCKLDSTAREAVFF